MWSRAVRPSSTWSTSSRPTPDTGRRTHGPSSRAWAEGDLGALDEPAAEVELAVRAATPLGFEPEQRELVDPTAAVDAFTRAASVHYLGHGFANAIGEALPLSADRVVSAAELSTAETSHAPFAFFNACLLGRVRHLPGGRQQGWALRLLHLGSPGVIGALAEVPDAACIPFAEAFYVAALKSPLGEAMRRVRAKLHDRGVHPLVWGAYVLHGDPNAAISWAIAGSTAELVRGWPALATRFLATGLPEYQRALLDALRSAPTAPAAVRDWAHGARVSEEALITCVYQLLDRDPEGAAACRILLALTRLEAHPDRTDELDVAHLAAAALEDGYAVLRVFAAGSRLWEQRFPNRRAELLSTARYWLEALAGDRPALAELETCLRRSLP